MEQGNKIDPQLTQRLTCVVDACHSGTCLDLPYELSSNSQMSSTKQLSSPNYMIFQYQQSSSGTLVQNGLLSKASVGDVVLFSSCKDAQTSSDETIKYSTGVIKSGGAMISAFLKAIKENPGASYLQIVNAMKKSMAEYSQVLQLSCGRPMDVNAPFCL